MSWATSTPKLASPSRPSAYDTVEFIATLAAIDQQVYNRELALFYANHDLKLEYALELASAELEFRKDIYGYDALAWTLYQNGSLDEAADAMDQAMKLGTKDALLFFHSGIIKYRLGDEDKVREHLSSALRLNPLSPSFIAPLPSRSCRNWVASQPYSRI